MYAILIEKKITFRCAVILQTRLALLKILSDLDEDDHLGLITFDSEVSLWKRELLKATEENLENAKSFVKEIRDRGGELEHINKE